MAWPGHISIRDFHRFIGLANHYPNFYKILNHYCPAHFRPGQKWNLCLGWRAARSLQEAKRGIENSTSSRKNFLQQGICGGLWIFQICCRSLAWTRMSPGGFIFPSSIGSRCEMGHIRPRTLGLYDTSKRMECFPQRTQNFFRTDHEPIRGEHVFPDALSWWPSHFRKHSFKSMPLIYQDFPCRTQEGYIQDYYAKRPFIGPSRWSGFFGPENGYSDSQI